MVIFVDLRVKGLPLAGFQYIPFLRWGRAFGLIQAYLPFKLVSPHALNHQPPENSKHFILFIESTFYEKKGSKNTSMSSEGNAYHICGEWRVC